MVSELGVILSNKNDIKNKFIKSTSSADVMTFKIHFCMCGDERGWLCGKGRHPVRASAGSMTCFFIQSQI